MLWSQKRERCSLIKLKAIYKHLGIFEQNKKLALNSTYDDVVVSPSSDTNICCQYKALVVWLVLKRKTQPNVINKVQLLVHL